MKTVRRGIPLLLALLLVLGTVLPTAVFATVTDPAGFTGDEISAVDLAVDSGYPWHAMTDDEAVLYGLSGDNIYIAGNSGSTAKSVSNLAITVTGSGALTFEYALSTYYDASDDLSINYFLGCRVGAQFSDTDTTANYTNPVAQGTVLPGEDGNWGSYTIPVDESLLGSDGTATIYIAYKHARHSDYGEGENFAAIRNVTYATGSKSVIEAYDTNMGTVKAELVTTASDGTKTYSSVGLDELAIGSTYRVTATANTGYQLMGWFRTYQYDGQTFTAYQPAENGAIEITVNDTTYYTPVFAEAGSFIARNGTKFYTEEDGLQAALDEAAGYTTVALLKSYTLTEDLTIPENVTLYVPFRDSWGTVENSAQYFLSTRDTSICQTAIAGTEKTFATLTVPSGKKITVNGALAVGAVNGYPSQRYQGHVSGAHGRITNNGTIEINDGAKFHAIGIVDGSGLVYVNDGGTLREPMIIGDFAGGNNSADLYLDNQMPFKRFSMQNVQCTLQMEARSTLLAFGNVWALSSYNNLDVELFGDSDMAAFRPNTTKADTVALTRTYDASGSLTDGNGLLDVTGIGRSNWTFNGGLTFQPFTIAFGIRLSTENADLPIPYNFNIKLTNGTYNISSGLRIMPGAEVTVDSSAIVKLGGRLLVMDGLVQTDMSSDRYPTKAELEAAGFKPYGVANLNGKMIMEAGSTLGGVINSSGGGTLVLQEGVYLINGAYAVDAEGKATATSELTPEKMDTTKELLEHTLPAYASLRTDNYYTGQNNWVQQDGSQGTYDENTVWFNLPAKLYDGETLIRPEAGKTYVSTAIEAASVSDTYEGLFVENGEYDSTNKYGADGVRDMSVGTYSFSRTVNAAWDDGSTELEITLGEGGVLPADRQVEWTAVNTGTDTVISGLTVTDVDTKLDAGEKYVFLVRYSHIGDVDEDTTVQPDTEGNYVIPADATGVTVSVALLGDINLDGAIGAADAAKTLRIVAELEVPAELQNLAADANADGVVGAADAAKILRVVAELEGFA